MFQVQRSAGLSGASGSDDGVNGASQRRELTYPKDANQVCYSHAYLVPVATNASET